MDRHTNKNEKKGPGILVHVFSEFSMPLLAEYCAGSIVSSGNICVGLAGVLVEVATSLLHLSHLSTANERVM